MDAKFPDYMRRLCDFRQMDFEATFDQLLTLLSVEPQQVYVFPLTPNELNPFLILYLLLQVYLILLS